MQAPEGVEHSKRRRRIAATFAARPQGAPPRSPTSLIIVADDMGCADMGVHGRKDIPTPNIDRLACQETRSANA
jgi:hypothetical protein